MRAPSNTTPASTPSRRLPLNLGAIQVWYKVETNCGGPGKQVWKSWEVQFLELRARESRTVPPSQRLFSGARRGFELRARSFKAIWIAVDLAATGMERHGTRRSGCPTVRTLFWTLASCSDPHVAIRASELETVTSSYEEALTTGEPIAARSCRQPRKRRITSSLPVEPVR